MAQVARLVRHRGAVPMYGYPTGLGVSPVSVVRAEHEKVIDRGPHIHEFPALWYAEGRVYVAAAGEVLDPGRVAHSNTGVGVFFDPATLVGNGTGPLPSWSGHPLLAPFLHGQPGGLLELRLPGDRRRVWDATIESIESELANRQDGYRQAVLAHLTLLLIDIARLAGDVIGMFARSGQPLLAEVFAVIDRRHAETLSLSDVAREVGMTPGHLTTIVRRRTGRTVQDWICERRMAEARRLLTDTELSIAQVAHRIGLADPGYFTRLFRRAHGASPREWRSAQIEQHRSRYVSRGG